MEKDRSATIKAPHEEGCIVLPCGHQIYESRLLSLAASIHAGRRKIQTGAENGKLGGRPQCRCGTCKACVRRAAALLKILAK
jgi:hypothetical protein